MLFDPEERKLVFVGPGEFCRKILKSNPLKDNGYIGRYIKAYSYFTDLPKLVLPDLSVIVVSYEDSEEDIYEIRKKTPTFYSNGTVAVLYITKRKGFEYRNLEQYLECEVHDYENPFRPGFALFPFEYQWEEQVGLQIAQLLNSDRYFF